jgi:hypothetical protein
LPDVGCGLWYDEDDDNTLKVYTPDMAGQGLNHDDTYCQLYIDPGCGITLEGGKKIGVDADSLAGYGLIKGEGCRLNVNHGCGLTIDDNTLKVYTPDIAGQGLNASEDGCQLYIDPGCGITLEGGKKVGVHADSLAGTCLVKEDDCKLGIDLTEQDGPVFSAVTAVNLYGNCYGIYLNWAVTPFGFKTNPCGLFLGFEAGEAFSSSTYVPLGCCCGDDPPPPPPPPPDPYWCVDDACVQYATEPDGATAGPFENEEDCIAYCGYTPPPPPDCCPIPNVLHATQTNSNLTGDCDGCLYETIDVRCEDGVWTLEGYSDGCGGVPEFVSVNCDPFEIVFRITVNNEFCQGTYDLVITE